MRCDQAKVCGKGFRMSDIKSVWLNDVMDVTLHNHNSTDTGGASTETHTDSGMSGITGKLCLIKMTDPSSCLFESHYVLL